MSAQPEAAGARDGAGSPSTTDADEELAQLFLARRGAAEVVSNQTKKQAAQLNAVRRAGYTEELVELDADDVVFAPDGEEHWHGASLEHFMTHLPITEGGPYWGAHVTDAEYNG